MAKRPTPTIRRWQLGQALRGYRDEAGVLLREAARTLELTAGALSKIENGRQTIRPVYIRALADVYGIDDETKLSLLALAEEANQAEWYVKFRTVPEWFRTFLGYESSASVVHTYSAELVDGLLQLPAYTRAVGAVNRPGSIEAELAVAIELREARRQRAMADDGPALHWIMNEAVVRRIVGSRAIMREQVKHLLDVTDKSHVTIQVLPFSAGAHPAMTAPFTLLGFDEYPAMDTVYMDNGRGASYFEAQADRELYRWRFDRLMSQALPVPETRTFLAKVVADL